MADMSDIPAPVPKDADALLETARKRFQMSIDATASNRPYQLDDVRFAAGSPDNGWQWPPDVLRIRQNDPNGPRPTLTINKLPQHIKLVTNEQRMNRPAVRVLPVDDNSDIEVAEVLTGIVRHIEVSSDADVAYDTACECQVTSGEGFFRVLTEYSDPMSFDQDIVIAPIKNPFSVYLEPDGLQHDATGKKCKWGFVTDMMSKEEYKLAFPKSKAAISWDVYAEGDAYQQWFLDDQIRIAEYFYMEPEHRKLIMWADGSTTLDGENPAIVGLAPMVRNGKPVERDTTIMHVKWCKLNGVEILEEEEWPGRYIPIIRVIGNEWIVDGQSVVAGIVRNAKDAQRMGNYMESMNVELTALAPKAPFVGAAGQFEGFEDKWDQLNMTPFPYVEYNPVSSEGTLVPPPKRMEPPMASTAIVQAVAAAWQNLQSTVGQYNPSLGAESQEKSGKAIQARQRQADVGTFHYIDNLGRGIRYLGCILVDLIPKIYDTRRAARIIGVDGEPDTVTLDPAQQSCVMEIADEEGAIQRIYNPNVGKYDVAVTVGPSYTTKRIEAAENMAEALQGNPALWGVIGDLYVKSQDWPGAQEMAERIRKTIPPNLLEGENEANDPEAKMQQVQQAAQALGQREAMLNAQAEQMEQAAEELAKKEQDVQTLEARAKSALAQVEAKIFALNAETQVFELTKQLAEKEIEMASMTLDTDRKLAKAEADKIRGELEAKMTEVNNASEELAEGQGDMTTLADTLKQVLDRLDQFEVQGAQ